MNIRWSPLPAGRFGAEARIAGIDPLLVWADGSAFRDFRRADADPPASVPVLCELGDRDDAIDRLAAELAGTGGGALPSAYPREPGRATRFCTATFSADYCTALAAGQVGTMLRRFELQLPVVPARPEPAQRAPALPPGPAAQRPHAAGRLLLGVVDSGCAFAHAGLRRAGGGTRVLALWDQDDAPGHADIGGACPADFGYGAEVHRTALDTLMRDCRVGGALDEHACYRRAARPGPRGLQRRMSHGAAVLDLMAGARPLGQRLWREPDLPPAWREAGDPASAADIVFVDLPSSSVQDSSSAGLGRWLLDGLRYICSCAGPDTKHIVVTVSNGTSRSTHDGGSIIEQAMAALVDEQRRLGRTLHIVVAAGNDRDEERHAQVDALSPQAPARLTLRVPPGSEAPTWVVVRVPPRAAGLGLRLCAPGIEAATTPAATLDGLAPAVHAGAALAMTAGPAAQAPAAVVFPAPRGDGASMALIVIAPTDNTGAGVHAAHGDWTVVLESAQAIAEPVHLYISRNQRNPGALWRGRQARFVANFAAYDPLRWRRQAETDPDPPGSPVRRCGTLNGLATLPPDLGVVVAGSLHQRPGTPSPYTSAGPSAGPAGGPSRQGPDMAAVTDLYRGLRGIVAAGSLSGAWVRVLGTSFAAPQAARCIANQGGLAPGGVTSASASSGDGGGQIPTQAAAVP